MKEKISSLQIGAIIWNLMLSSYIGILPYILFYQLKQDSWISVLCTFILGFLIVFLYLYIWDKHPEKNLFEKIEYVCGHKLGTMINFLFTITVCYMLATYFYNMITFITSQYLVKTPLLFVVIIFLIPVIYLVIQKLEVIGRVIFIFFIIGAFLFLLTFLGLAFQLDFTKLLPIMENGPLPIAKSVVTCLPYTNFILFLLMAIPKENIIDKEKVNKRFIIFYALTFFNIFTGIVFITATLGGELAKIYQFAEFQVLKRVSLIGFIERIESTLSIRWILYMFASVIIGLYFIKKYMKHQFKLKNKENLAIIIVSIILLIGSKWLFPNNTSVNEIMQTIIPYFLYIFYLILPIIIAIGLKIKKS